MIDTPTEFATQIPQNCPFISTARIHKVLATGLCAALALGASGCSIHTGNGGSGDDKNVRIDTPFGDLHVNTDQTTAGDLGLAVYPGAQVVRDKDSDKSADVHLGLGKWQLSVKAVNYATPDNQEKVTAFYKKALGRFGDVITCSHHTAVGTPSVTAEGLTCSDDTGSAKVKINGGEMDGDSDGFELKAGSRHHQHILAFDDSKDGKTHFALLEIELPTGLTNSGKSD